jgi:hypothetical protein
VSEETNYAWLRRIGRYWILPAEMTPMVSVPLCALVAKVGPSAGIPDRVVSYACWSLVGITVIGLVGQNYLFYNAILCPACGHKPNRTVEGRRMRHGMNAMWTRLRRLERCPKCNA